MADRETVVVLSKRDERVLAWLIAQVGEDGITEACSRLMGARRSYPSNIAKALGLKPVSYTHLDVYKRQPIALPPLCACAWRAAWRSRIAAVAASKAACCSGVTFISATVRARSSVRRCV